MIYIWHLRLSMFKFSNQLALFDADSENLATDNKTGICLGTVGDWRFAFKRRA